MMIKAKEAIILTDAEDQDFIEELSFYIRQAAVVAGESSVDLAIKSESAREQISDIIAELEKNGYLCKLVDDELSISWAHHRNMQ